MIRAFSASWCLCVYLYFTEILVHKECSNPVGYGLIHPMNLPERQRMDNYNKKGTYWACSVRKNAYSNIHTLLQATGITPLSIPWFLWLSKWFRSSFITEIFSGSCATGTGFVCKLETQSNALPHYLPSKGFINASNTGQGAPSFTVEKTTPPDVSI